MDEANLFDDDPVAEGAAELTRRSLLDTQQRLGVMLDILPIALLIHTEQGILFANQEACALLLTEQSALTGQHLLDFVGSEDHASVSQTFSRAFASEGQTRNHECVIVRRDSSQRLINLILGRLPWPGNPVIQVLMQDVTDQKRAEASLRQLTITDELTGAYNRRHVFYEAQLYIDQFASTRIPLSVALIDVDHFKRINDTYGHTIGDLALVRMTRLANSLLPTLRDSDSAIFARIGGEEFVLLLPGLAAARARQVAETLRASIAQLDVPTPNGAIGFSASMGVATYCQADGSFSALLARADAALYRAKRAGRDCVVAAD